MSVDIVVGGQFGSEGKGVVCAAIADNYGAHVRVGGPNAGHSIVFDGKLYKMQAVPCGWVNRSAKLILGPGAVISLKVLEREILDIRLRAGMDIRPRLAIDPRATILSPSHEAEEGHTEGEGHKRIGSTGEGIGAARLDRMRRDEATGFKTAETICYQNPLVAGLSFAAYVEDTLPLLRRIGESVLIEGTQGFGLSLVHGEWPYTTSADTTAGTIAADCGIGPRNLRDIWAVFRSMPIRVAGNSGPLRFETDWGILSKRLGKPVEERTTVTKKVRRIGGWDWELFQRSCEINTPNVLVLTFADYINPADSMKTAWGELSGETQSHVLMMERLSGAHVAMVGTGFNPESGWVYVRR